LGEFDRKLIAQQRLDVAQTGTPYASQSLTMPVTVTEPALKDARILLLGDSRMAFPIAKALSKQGASVFAGVSVYSNYLEWSRYVVCTFQHPSTDTGTDEALPYILHWLDQNAPVTAIQPVSESATRLISRHRSLFESYARLIMPSADTVKACGRKSEMFETCDALGIPLAPYRIVTSKRELFDAAADIGFPVIVKPSCVDAELFGRKALIIHSTADLNIWVTEWPEIHPELIVQRFVRGPRHSVVFSAEQGKILKAVEVLAQRTHENDGTGYTTLGIAIEPTPVVKAATEALVKHLNYSSTGCTQFIVDPNSGEVTFMELNPRTSLARIAEAAGVPHSVLGFETALGLAHADLGAAWSIKTGTRYVWTKGDIMRLKRGLKSRQIKPIAIVPEFFKIGIDALRAEHAILDLSDPAPAIGTYFNVFLKHARRQRTYDLEMEPAI